MFINWFLAGFVPSFTYLKNPVCCAFSSILFMALSPEKPMPYRKTCSWQLLSGTATLQFLKILHVAKGMGTPGRKGGLLWRKGKAGENQTKHLNQNVPCEKCWFMHTYVRCTSVPQKLLFQSRRELSLKGWGWALCFCLVPLSKHFPYQQVFKKFRIVLIEKFLPLFTCENSVNWNLYLNASLRIHWSNYQRTKFIFQRKFNMVNILVFSGLLDHV